jgi:Ankyrin repeats (3 copies)
LSASHTVRRVPVQEEAAAATKTCTSLQMENRRVQDGETGTSLPIDDDNYYRHQLLLAIDAGYLEGLRAILSQQQDGWLVVTEEDIETALVHAVRYGHVQACRVLWQSLRPSEKQVYLETRVFGIVSVLHEATQRGHLEVVRFFIEECGFNVNQEDRGMNTALFYAYNSAEITGYLLEKGANVEEGSLYNAARHGGNADVVRLLLLHGADPGHPRLADEAGLAIQNGNVELLEVLLEDDAVVSPDALRRNNGSTALNVLLQHDNVARESKLDIAFMLVEHAKRNYAGESLLRLSLEHAIQQHVATHDSIDGCEILLEAGMNPRSRWVWNCAIQLGNQPVCQLLVQYGADPFLDEGDEDDENEEHIPASPFQVAASLDDTSIFEYLLELWDARFSLTGGKNTNGAYPLHVVCCDPRVSLPAIKVLVHRHADVLVVGDVEQGLLPFHFAANWGASLDVIFYLLQHCPDVLRHIGGNTASVAPSRPSPRNGGINGVQLCS